MKPLRLLVLLVSLLLLLGGCGEKGDVPVTSLKYKIRGDGITITGCDDNALGKLIIPAAIEGKSVTSIGKYAFSDCNSLTSITIPDGVTSIGGGAFEECESLTSITIPDSVTSIGSSAFRGCASLTSIIIPDGVTSIGDEAFIGCSGLSGIFIPDSVTSIGDMAFSYCRNLIDIKVGEGNVNYTDVNGVLFNEGQTLLTAYPAGKAETNYTIPDSVTRIGWYAFGACSSLISITIPDGITFIGDCAFLGCSSLTSITIPEGVTIILNATFMSCTSLTAVTFLGDAPKSGNYVFGQVSTTIYRKPEAKGWGDKWSDKPVKLISENP